MRADTLGILRCPYCGGRLDLVESLPHSRHRDAISHGVIGCHCCLFPVVAGIPVMHLGKEVVAAREALEAGRTEHAFASLIAPDRARAERFQEASESPTVTYRELMETLDEDAEAGYFLYRFSDPSYVVADAVIRAVGAVVLHEGGRAIDVCGGSGHLTRSLLAGSGPPPVIADLSFAKLWLAARFVAPGCEPVCCDANAPLPFGRGAFRLTVCADAFMYVWTKRQLASEMTRLIDGDGPSATVITHAHNSLVWSHSQGDALPPEGYRALFETVDPRLYSEAGLLDNVIAGGPIDLSRKDDADQLAGDPALCIVATRTEEVLRTHPLQSDRATAGMLRTNPLYEATEDGPNTRLRLRFPTPEYEEEFGACRRYLPDEVALDATTMNDVENGSRSSRVLELLRRRVVLELPERYC